MEKAVDGDYSLMHLDYTEDVMNIMTDIRKQWGMKYPEEMQLYQNSTAVIKPLCCMLILQKMF